MYSFIVYFFYDIFPFLEYKRTILFMFIKNITCTKFDMKYDFSWLTMHSEYRY